MTARLNELLIEINKTETHRANRECGKIKLEIHIHTIYMCLCVYENECVFGWKCVCLSVNNCQSHLKAIKYNLCKLIRNDYKQKQLQKRKKICFEVICTLKITSH